MNSNCINLSFQFNMTLVTSRLFKVLIISELTILFFDIFVNHHRWIDSRPMQRFFNITREDSFPNWFSSSQAIGVAIVLLLIWHVERKKEFLSPTNKGWATLSGIFMFLGFDDATRLHERLGSTFDAKFENQDGLLGSLLEWFPSYTWQIVVLPVFVLFGLYMVYFLYFNISNHKSRRFIMIAFCGYGLAIGLDFVEGLDYVFDTMSEQFGLKRSLLLHSWKALEETIEMFSTTLFLIAFMEELGHRAPKMVDSPDIKIS